MYHKTKKKKTQKNNKITVTERGGARNTITKKKEFNYQLSGLVNGDFA